MTVPNSTQLFAQQGYGTRLVFMPIAFLLILYTGFVIPFHHHADGESHDQCTICIVKHQAVKITPVFVLPEIIATIDVLFSPTGASRVSPFVAAYRTRGPPLG